MLQIKNFKTTERFVIVITAGDTDNEMIVFKYITLALCLQFTLVFCENLENSTAAAVENSTSPNFPARKARATYDFVYADLIGCAVQSDASCLVNVAEDFLAVKKNELLGKFL